MKGQRVETLVEENKFAGKYTLKWNTERISSGVYFYQIKAGNFQQTRKCLILK
ncbi:MAG: T9SS type A sorting domain-containing protein [Candidatus Marinimicrobia bacterium]|nr:T9SS type A sorting domain-containing protein [Candidatus Neomarinimicrobiota bacterium]